MIKLDPMATAQVPAAMRLACGRPMADARVKEYGLGSGEHIIKKT
jgi:hypothetical protein